MTGPEVAKRVPTWADPDREEMWSPWILVPGDGPLATREGAVRTLRVNGSRAHVGRPSMSAAVAATGVLGGSVHG